MQSPRIVGYTAADIKVDLNKVYGVSTLCYPTDRKWVHLSKSIRTNNIDEHRPGRPPSAASDKDVGAVKATIDEDPPWRRKGMLY